MCHASGFMQSEIFFSIWFYHFLNYAKPSNIDPILFFLIGLQCMRRTSEFIEKAKYSNMYFKYTSECSI
jgi:hypothetical protein